jgi:hypothetical protein
MLRAFAYFVSALGLALGAALLIVIPVIAIPACAQDAQSQDPAIPVPAIRDPAIREIPPAMNLLSEIPISQTESGTPAAQAKAATQNAPVANSALPKVETFTGTVAKGSDGYFLQGPDGTSYRLDDGSKAGSYEGRKVQIVGRLELDTNLIHIDRIESAP